MLILLTTLLLIAVCFALKELVAVRREVSSIRQFLEWTALGLLENGKDTMNPAMREYLENTKRDLIREGVRDGTLNSEQQAKEMMRLAREQAEQREPSLAPAPEHRIPNPDMTGWKSAQKSQNL